MQCQEIRYQKLPVLSQKNDNNSHKNEKETIHSGHFMVSHFEAEAQDDEYEVAVPVPEPKIQDMSVSLGFFGEHDTKIMRPFHPGPVIETSLTKLFQCMSLAYRQKLTSPKWNRFKGIRLRWKDKIRLNNVIWRCWHMQFIKKKNTLICQFASPLDEGTHNKPEAVVLEGKYWKRKLAAVTAEYKRWRMFYRNKIMGWGCKEGSLTDMDLFDWQPNFHDNNQFDAMMTNEDYLELMSDTLFTTITSNQPFAFPDTREIARGVGIADFIQPSLVQLQPNLEDFMDTLEPLQDFFTSKLPPVPEECAVGDVLSNLGHLTQDASVQYNSKLLSQQQQSQQQPTAGPAQPTYQHQQRSVVKMEEYIDYSTKHSQQQQQQQPVASRHTILHYQQQQPQSVINNSKMNHMYVSYGGAGTGYTVHSPPLQPSYTQSTPMLHQQHSPQPMKSLKTSGRSASLPCVDKRDEMFVVPKVNKSYNLKQRQRTRSGSSLILPNQRQQPPPLVSTVSDPAFNIPANALLAQLLTNNTAVYNLNPAVAAAAAGGGGGASQDRAQQQSQHTVKSTNVPILPMPPKLLPLSNTTMQAANVQQATNFVISTTSGLTSPSSNNQGMLSSGGVRNAVGNESPTDSSQSPNIPSPSGLSHSPLSTSPIVFTTGPLSPNKSPSDKTPFRSPPGVHNEHRRVCHINAEQKRRYNIRSGFDTLHSLIPHLHQNPNVKLSKAAMLQKGAEYIRQLQAERVQLKEEMESLKCQIDHLNVSISNCQSLLPATGAPVSRHRTTKMKEMFDEFVRIRTLDNWKFWIFSILFEPLLQSFNCSVSTASYQDLCRTTLIWIEQHCSLVDLRPAVLNSLRHLSTSTEILTEPSRLAEEARTAVSKK